VHPVPSHVSCKSCVIISCVMHSVSGVHCSGLELVWYMFGLQAQTRSVVAVGAVTSITGSLHIVCSVHCSGLEPLWYETELHAHTRSVVAMGAVNSYIVTVSQTVSAVHARSDVRVGAVVW
jgi:hypothetical protein